MRRSHIATIESANVTLLVNGNLDGVGDYFTTDYVAHFTGQDFGGGHDLIKKFVRTYRRAFSGIQIDVEILVKGKHRVAWQRTMRATHKAAFRGFPATGLPIVWRDMITTEFRDGLMAEDWIVSDLAEKLLLARKK